LNVKGQNGSTGTVFWVGQDQEGCCGGAGGNSILGFGGPFVFVGVLGNTGGNAGSVYGGGGGGGARGGSGPSNVSGGAGAAGCVIFEW